MSVLESRNFEEQVPAETAPVRRRGRHARHLLVAVMATLLLASVSVGIGAGPAEAGPTCGGKAATHLLSQMTIGADGFYNIYGTGTNVVVGTSGADKIRSYSRIDYICGLGGDDVIHAGGGDDWIWGGQGKDTILGGDGNDTIHGEDGNDILKGGAGNDKIYGGNHNDEIHGEAGRDDLRGQNGADTLHGGDQEDKLYGGAHKDILNGNRHDDLLFGQQDDDTLDGGWDNDTLKGGPGYDVLKGNLGNDWLYGDDGNASTDGINDSLHGGQDTDQCIDGGGRWIVASTCENSEKPAPTTTTTTTTQPAPTTSTTKQATTTTTQQTTTTTATSKGYCNGLAVTILVENGGSTNGTPGVDVILATHGGTIRGGLGNDHICGGSRIFGDEGDDYIRADGLTNTIEGGDGVDTIIGTSGRELISGGSGNDLIKGNGGGDTIDGNGGVDTITAGDGEGARISGGSGNDSLTGGNGDDKIDGGSGSDQISGGSGDDELIGSAGNDVIRGGSGDDTLIGGTGNDQLWGEFGNDHLIAIDRSADLTRDGVDTVRPGSGCDEVEWDKFDNDYFEFFDNCDSWFPWDANYDRQGSAVSLPSGVRYPFSFADGKALGFQIRSDLELATTSGSGINPLQYCYSNSGSVTTHQCRAFFGVEEADDATDGALFADTRYDVDYLVPKYLTTTVDESHPRYGWLVVHQDSTIFEGCKSANKVYYVCDYMVISAVQYDSNTNGAYYLPAFKETAGDVYQAVKCTQSIVATWVGTGSGDAVIRSCEGYIPGGGGGSLSNEPPVVSDPVDELVPVAVEVVLSEIKQSNQDAFVIYTDGDIKTRQWINADCYSSLGVEGRLVSYSVDIQPITNQSGKHTCAEIKTMLGSSAPAPVAPVADGGSARVVLSEIKNTDQDAFVLYDDNTRQWINATCYASLGVQGELVSYSLDIQPITNQSGKHTCAEIKTMLG